MSEEAAKTEELPKIDLTSCRLEVHKFPQNCQAVVLAEFWGGHRKGGTPPFKRKLTWEEWDYVLRTSLAGNTSGGGSKLGQASVLTFSERKSQSEYLFSAKNLFEAMMEQEGFKGSVTSDRYYNFYQVMVPTDYKAKLREASHVEDFKRIKLPDTVSKGVERATTYTANYW